MTKTITSRHNPRIKSAAKLRERRGRREQQRFLIDGVRELARALDAGINVQEAFVCESMVDNDGQALQRRLLETGCEVLLVTESVLEKIAFGDRSDGIVGAAAPRPTTLNGLSIQDEMLIAVLENIEKPGNVGAVLRSADAAGVSAVIVANAGTDLYNPNSIRASAGCIFSLPLVACSSEEALSWLRQHAFRIVTARVDGADNYASVSYSGRSAIVLGSESQGLSNIWRGGDMVTVTLPMHGIGDSLNVSVTAAVLFYEVLRQRDANPKIKR